jgi:hypothetical protein
MAVEQLETQNLKVQGHGLCKGHKMYVFRCETNFIPKPQLGNTRELSNFKNIDEKGTHRVLHTWQIALLRITSWWDCRAASRTISSNIAEKIVDA